MVVDMKNYWDGMKTKMKKQIPISEVLSLYYGVTVAPDSDKIACPIHGGDKIQFQVSDTEGIVTCYTQCGKTWDIFGLVEDKFSIGFTEARDRLIKDFGVNINPYGEDEELEVLQPQKKVSKQVVTSKNTKKKDFTKFYNTLLQDDYFLKRGLSIEIIEKYGLGTVGPETDLNIFSKKERKILANDNPYVIPISNSFFTARQDDEITGKDVKKYHNPTGCAHELFNAHYIGNEEINRIFIVEGVIDALSIETLGFDAISLNGVSNANKLIKAIQSNEEAREQQFILLADNDKAGKELEKELLLKFKQANMTLYLGEIPGGHKDINEILIADKDEAEKVIENIIDNMLNSKSAYNLLFKHFRDPKPVDPIRINEFPELNDFVRGLRGALYVVGGISSVGKTTFVQNIADDIAAKGEHILFFSLEMGEKVLLAKSLVKEMHKIAIKDGTAINQFGAKITGLSGLLDGKIVDHLLYQRAIGEYAPIARNIFIHEGTFNFTVDDIRREVESHIKLHGVKPIVIVDYLQILQPIDPRHSERQTVDISVKGLKQTSRDLDIPVIAISSFNRASYTGDIGFEAFKESGAIEYGSDVVLALNLDTSMLSDDEKKDKKILSRLKSKDIRAIELSILKNRLGRSTGSIKYSYWAQFNKFVENEPTIAAKKTEETKKKRL